MTSLEAVFRIANFGAVIAWIVLVLAAVFGWRGALTGFCGRLVPLLLAAAYVVLLVTHWNGAQVDFTSLAGVGSMFRQARRHACWVAALPRLRPAGGCNGCGAFPR